jgi:hypothetical protein
MPLAALEGRTGGPGRVMIAHAADVRSAVLVMLKRPRYPAGRLFMEPYAKPYAG